MIAEPDRSIRKQRRGVPAAFWWSVTASAALTVFLLTSLPNISTGEESALRKVLTKLHILERKVNHVPSLAAYKLPGRVVLCDKQFPLDRSEVKEALEREFYLSLGRRSTPILWIKRASKYFPYIESRLKAYKMPDDLKYLAVAESDLKLYARSPAGAVGMWQFIPGTGRRWGLRVDGHFDERRDFVRSTESAMKFLQNLYGTFNDWHLAMAAYNAGPGRVGSELKAQKVDNYFDLNLPLETERYIFRIAAIKIIMSNPASYGLDLPKNELYSPGKYDTVNINIPVKNLYLGVMADAVGVTFKEIRELNPALESDYLPRGNCRLNLPAGSSEKFLLAWEKIKRKKAFKTGTPRKGKAKRRVHKVRPGETLGSIAHRYRVSVSDLCRWNRLNRKSVLRVGKRLVIYR